MEIISEKIGDMLVIRPPVETLDAGNAKEFKNEMLPCLEASSKVTMDMSKIKFIDSTGLGAIISCLRTLNSKRGDLRIFAMQKTVRALFKLVRLHRIIDIYNVTFLKFSWYILPRCSMKLQPLLVRPYSRGPAFDRAYHYQR